MKTRTQIGALALATALAFSPIATKRAEAAVGGVITLFGGGAVGVPVMAVGGLMTLGGGVVAAVACAEANSGGGWGAALNCVIVGYAAAAFALAGLVVLDEHGDHPTMGFGELSAENARRLGLSGEQIAVYHHELPELNAAMQQIEADMTAAGENTLPQALARWQELKPMFSADAVLVAERVSRAMAESMAQAAK
ncbi:MAG: hypothetical protein IT285_05590 [Bdellovibrionales bacterium]|nr:hypothetical protein [Bdellovibrionales bacterium]